MSFQHRPMRPADALACAGIVAAHPVIGPRYGSAIADLGPAWIRLVGCESSRTVVLEDVEGSRARICGLGVSIFVDDEFMRELKTPPLRWFGAELASRMARGEAPFLSGKQLQDANSNGGVNLLVWEACVCPEDGNRAEIIKNMMSAFLEIHRGFLWKEAIHAQVESAARLRTMSKMGWLFWDPATGSYLESPKHDLEQVAREPHILGLTRNAKPEQLVSWLGTLFDYQAPRFGFSRGEQRLLGLALAGETDKSLAVRLGVSVSGVKKMWLSIYDRLTPRGPGWNQNAALEAWTFPRGMEKKRRLLAYLRTHPEELCPISRKLFWRRTTAAGVGAQPMF